MSNRRKINDYFYQMITYSAAFIAVATLSLIFIFVFINGYKLLNIGLVINDYNATFYNGGLEEGFEFSTTTKPEFLDNEVYYSKKWGLGLKDSIDREGNPVIVVDYIAVDSPLLSMFDKNIEDKKEPISFEVGQLVSKIAYFDKATSLTRTGAEAMILDLDSSDSINDIVN